MEGDCSLRVVAQISVGHSRDLLSGVFPILPVYGLYNDALRSSESEFFRFIHESATLAVRCFGGLYAPSSNPIWPSPYRNNPPLNRGLGKRAALFRLGRELYWGLGRGTSSCISGVSKMRSPLESNTSGGREEHTT